MIDVTEEVLGDIKAKTNTPDLLILGGLVVFAMVLRLLVQAANPHFVYADSLYQSIEQAHRIVFGTGVIPWEFQIGIRSWILPGLLVPAMLLGKIFGPNPDAILFPVYIFLAALSCLPIICAYLWGKRFGGFGAAIIAGFLNAIWVDNIFFSTQALSEVIAADFLILALYLGYPGTEVLSRRRIFLAGMVFGLTFTVRFHICALLLVAFVWIGGRQFKRAWIPLLAGAAIPVIGAGFLDWITWSYPFQSIWLNIWVNVVNKISAFYGLEPVSYFFMAPMYYWGGACALVALTAFIGAARLPMLMAASLALFATMTLFGHKEYRFIYPAIPLIITLAGLGTAEVVRVVWQNYGRKVGRFGTLVTTALCFWAFTSLALAKSPAFASQWGAGRAESEAFHMVAMSPEICGVAVYHWSWLPLGRTGMRPDVELDESDDRGFAAHAGGFNAVIADARYSATDPRFKKRACWEDHNGLTAEATQTVCLWERPGTCVPNIARPYRLPWPKTLDPAILPDLVARHARHWAS